VDFYRVVVNEKKDGTLQIRPDWIVGKSKDLMTRNGSFYAIWDEERGLWSKDIYDVQRLVDEELERYAQEQKDLTGVIYKVSKLENNGTKLWDEFQRFIRNSGNNSHPLDEKLIFANTPVVKEDYASRKLSYSLADGPFDAWDMLVGTLYNDEERAKIEWAIGSVVSGESKKIQKFLVFYGPPASGKSTILNIIQRMFEGYTAVFDARELAGNNNSFATAAFKSNPLVAIQHDGDLSRIYDNTKLNSIVAHETMVVNEKYKAPVEARSNAFLFMGTNVPVKISDAKAGIIRRLIDVVPTQKTIDHDGYHHLMDQIMLELGAIAKHCLDRYILMGKNFYSSYRPKEMMLQTDVFYNFVEAFFDIFKAEDGIALKHAWDMYKQYCSDTGIDKLLPQYKFRDELKNYFYKFEDRVMRDGEIMRNYYEGFKHLEPKLPVTELPIKPEGPYQIELGEGPSIFDEKYAAMPAQYAHVEGYPERKWANVETVLADLDTSRLHYVKVPENHIVIDFDLVDEDGEKDILLNLKEASKWPATYAEVSKSGHGIHLHYIYMGEDVRELASVFDVGIEVKTLLGDSSLRRKLTLCNSVNITPLESGLPKKEKSLISTKTIKTEKGLRELIERNLRKEIHPGTKPSIDFIYKILEDAYESGMAYDLTDMRSNILTFAAKSTNQSTYCLKVVQKMKFASESMMPEVEAYSDELIFFDVEVYPNLLIICWKIQGADAVVRMINPEPSDIEDLIKMRLIGFNCRRYDNHIVYARYIGFTLEECFYLSQKLINAGNNRDPFFGEAYNLSYCDIYEFSSKKQSLKKFMIDLDIHHVELDLPWDEPVPEELWPKIEEYCVNDVIASEAVFEDRKQDYIARQILASLSGLSMNHTTQMHTARIIFGENKNPQGEFVYTDLSKEFPGYKYDGKASTYRDEVTGEGGYVYAEPGVYENVSVLDIASMHPTSIEQLNLFGHYTKNYSALKEARLAIKHKDYEKARSLYGGKLAPYLEDEAGADNLAYALKIVINIVYGLTSASFANPFRDNRNKDNIVAKRGALYMIDLKIAVQDQGYKVVHIKTDSIKIPNATEELIQFITEHGNNYGYHFEHEDTYDWFCLVNDAVYISRVGDVWNAVGAQFQHPYVFKTLFSKEPIEFRDYFEPKNVVKGRMYLDFVGDGDVENMVHVGRTNSFVPVLDGGTLWRVQEDKKYAVSGTKGYLWVDRDTAIHRQENDELKIDMSYFDHLKEEAIKAITKYDELYPMSFEA
jgi:Family of unknown function (DUF5906)